MAIEDAAALSNVLRDLLVKQGHRKPSVVEVDSAMEAFNRHRLPRAASICRYGSFLCRLTNRDGIFMALFSRYVVPYTTSLSSYLARQIVAFADIVGYLDVPIRAGSDFHQPKSKRSWPPSLATLVAFTLVPFLVLSLGHCFRNQFLGQAGLLLGVD
jgi:FAD dependent monooxygenase